MTIHLTNIQIDLRLIEMVLEVKEVMKMNKLAF